MCATEAQGAASPEWLWSAMTTHFPAARLLFTCDTEDAETGAASA